MKFNLTKNIKASPETIWSFLADGPGFHKWNPLVVKIDGEISLGKTIKMFTKDIQRPFTLKVTEFEKPFSMKLVGGLPLGLFKGVRSYILKPLDDGSTEFTMSEVFSGPLLSIIGKKIPDMNPSFAVFAKELTSVAEKKSKQGEK